MSNQVRASSQLLGVLLAAFALGACATVASDVAPSPQPYTFLSADKTFAGHVLRLYPKDEPKEPLRLAASLTKPDGYKICFSEFSEALPITGAAGPPNTFRVGVYPFRLYKEPPGKTAGAFTSCHDAEAAESFSGAMVVYNLDKAVELATFGRSDETLLFRPDLVEKAKTGVLTNYTISFDGQARIVYWIGNRHALHKGGRPTVELDFGKTPGLDEVRINGDKVRNLLATVPVFSEDVKAGRPRLEHKLVMRLKDGTEFRGYVRNLTDNAYTAFMKVPCTIPTDLFEAAKKGTIAKLNILSEGEDRAPIAEIVFGLAQRTE